MPTRTMKGVFKVAIFEGDASLVQDALNADVHCLLADDEHGSYGRFTFKETNPGFLDGSATVSFQGQLKSVPIHIHPKEGPVQGGCFGP